MEIGFAFGFFHFLNVGLRVRLRRWITCLKGEETATGEAASGRLPPRWAPAAELFQVVGSPRKDTFAVGLQTKPECIRKQKGNENVTARLRIHLGAAYIPTLIPGCRIGNVPGSPFRQGVQTAPPHPQEGGDTSRDRKPGAVALVRSKQNRNV